MVQRIPVFIIDDSPLDWDRPLKIDLQSPQVDLRLADVLFLGRVGRPDHVELVRGGRLEFQGPEAGGRFVRHLVGPGVQDAVAEAVDAVFGHFEEDFLSQAGPAQGALQAAVSIGADGQDAPDSGVQRRLGLAAQLESHVEQAAARQRGGLDIGFFGDTLRVDLQQISGVTRRSAGCFHTDFPS